MTSQARNSGTLTAQTKSGGNVTWNDATFTWDSATDQTWDDPTAHTTQSRNTGTLTPQTKH